ncbi:LacI family transcriptional regulator [Jannaschia pagri]|uniref:LacI family transcriptional regulator n=1 Tax=Jannaschia pagri TaxID=2829797 RepID=A0ABQ4NIM5_9RHOB|nr:MULTISPECIES: LacI family DNA-binding transcriptional regulator [unclassified Jannaschia]GIT89625.1 LacI family transcriptional regulator [Jannaschia sp. AI_61]GIT94267.1 LacI family transcriptional regulator [Jannaschia sp. AI_62]
MHDVAGAAGVSQMTVSRVLRGEGYVSQDVKKRVADAVADLGYIHNRLASVQRGMKNNMVGVILPTLKNTVFTDVLGGINDALAQLNMRPIFGVTEYSEAEEETLVRDMLAWQTCGLILPGLEHSDAVRRAVAQTEVRVAEIMDVEGPAISASFGISQQAAGTEMAEHLLSRGYRNIAYLGSQGGGDLRAAKRYGALKATLQAGGARIVNERIADAASSMPLGRALTEACLTQAPECDAIYFSNDDLAAGGLMHCLAAGVSVPEDVALAGFNGLPFLDALPRQITTTRTPRYEIGAQAARFVAGAVAGPERAHVLAADLVVGDTT